MLGPAATRGEIRSEFSRSRGPCAILHPPQPGLSDFGVGFDEPGAEEILKRLYYPDSPYEFSVLPADILGQVYEQFLGKVIRLTAGHRAVVEDKPEVKKAGGVCYTPTYIVDYIVKNTVGKLLEKSTPKKASSLRILDPACGSGSFLIGAFQYLIDWHRDWYVEDGPQKHTKEIFLGPGGEWRLTTAEKKRILLNNVYGVDIDSQAVETTKLSLLLKVRDARGISRKRSNRTSFTFATVLPVFCPPTLDVEEPAAVLTASIGLILGDVVREFQAANGQERRLSVTADPAVLRGDMIPPTSPTAGAPTPLTPV